MRPIDFEWANVAFTKPEGMREEECLPLTAYKGVDDAGRPMIVTMWQPNKEDLEALAAGRPVMVRVSGQFLPPMLLATTDEEGNLNV